MHRLPVRSALILTVLLCAPAPLIAQFVSPASVDFQTILAASPAPDSSQTRQEIEKMLALQQSRTPQDIARAKSEVHLNPFIFSDVLGSWFNPDDLPLTAKLLKEAGTETGSITSRAKQFYARKRPFLIDSRIHPAVMLESSFSYPSGHSTTATVWAMVLARLLPSQRDALMARSRQIGDDRVLGGVHFPSDVTAGRTLAAAIFKQMSDNPDFQAQAAQAAQECQSHQKSN